MNERTYRPFLKNSCCRESTNAALIRIVSNAIAHDASNYSLQLRLSEKLDQRLAQELTHDF
jgi:hypothetical protein